MNADSTVPRHIAIIMDGNGRWAQARGLPREEGHRRGVENVRKIVSAAQELGIEHLTLYAFSMENWNRPKAEVAALMFLLESFLKSQKKELIEKKIRLNVIGRIEQLPDKVRKRLLETIEATRDFSEYTLTLALSYGSRAEVLDAVKSLYNEMKSGELSIDNLDWSTFEKHLYTNDLPDPDFVIRTSGEFRISNFLLVQSAYAEYYFAKECWPEFGPESFKAAIETYMCRERRFGMTGEQVKLLNK